LVFYLTPSIRAGICPDQLQQLTVEDAPRLRPGDVVAVPERKASKLSAYYDLRRERYESVGSYRLYPAALSPTD
jgi:hypothetical protein